VAKGFRNGGVQNPIAKISNQEGVVDRVAQNAKPTPNSVVIATAMFIVLAPKPRSRRLLRAMFGVVWANSQKERGRRETFSTPQ
jgi:hypothetical protein